MPQIKINDGESFEFALRKFKRTCERAGILSELKKREYYEKPTMKRKKKAIASQKKRALSKKHGFRAF